MTLGNTLLSGVDIDVDVEEEEDDDDDDDRTSSLALLINAMTVSEETTVDASVTMASIRAVACFKRESFGVVMVGDVGVTVTTFDTVAVVSPEDVLFSAFCVIVILSLDVVVGFINNGNMDSILNTCDNGLRK
jgi:hypothetical protein